MQSYWDTLPKDVKKYILTFRDIPEIKAKKELLCSQIRSRDYSLFTPSNDRLWQVYNDTSTDNHQVKYCDFYTYSWVGHFPHITNVVYRIQSIFQKYPKLEYMYQGVNDLVTGSPCHIKHNNLQEDETVMENAMIIELNTPTIKVSYTYEVELCQLCYECYSHLQNIIHISQK